LETRHSSVISISGIALEIFAAGAGRTGSYHPTRRNRPVKSQQYAVELRA
jgi:hypothetical protein